MRNRQLAEFRFRATGGVQNSPTPVSRCARHRPSPSGRDKDLPLTRADTCPESRPLFAEPQPPRRARGRRENRCADGGARHAAHRGGHRTRFQPPQTLGCARPRGAHCATCAAAARHGGRWRQTSGHGCRVSRPLRTLSHPHAVETWWTRPRSCVTRRKRESG